LRFQCAKSQSNLLLYCVMPDHLHAVIAIGESDLMSIVRDLKTWTTSQWQKQTGQERLWQLSFHDQGIRRVEHIDELTRYVTENPSDAGLVSEWWDYPWSGGSLLEEGHDETQSRGPEAPSPRGS
jgi:REP element-mobilizing transposase RayT